MCVFNQSITFHAGFITREYPFRDTRGKSEESTGTLLEDEEF